MASDSTAGYSNQAIPLQAHVSSSASLHNSQTILLLFLPHFYTMYLQRLPLQAGHAAGRMSSACPLRITFSKSFRLTHYYYSHSPSSILSSPLHLNLAISVLFFSFNPLYQCVLSCFHLKPPPPQLLSGFLISKRILNVTYTSKISKLTFTNEGKQVTFIFLYTGFLTQNDCFQLNSLTCEFHFFLQLNNKLHFYY